MIQIDRQLEAGRLDQVAQLPLRLLRAHQVTPNEGCARRPLVDRVAGMLPLIVDTNTVITIAQVLPVFLLASVVDGLAMSARYSEKSARRAMLSMAIGNAVLICVIELRALAEIGTGRTLHDWQALGWLGFVAIVMLISITQITFAALDRDRYRRWREKREARLSRVVVEMPRPKIQAPAMMGRRARNITALASRRR